MEINKPNSQIEIAINQSKKISQEFIKNKNEKKYHWIRNIFLFFILTILFYFSYRNFTNKIAKISELEKINANIIAENSDLRTFVFGTCQLNAFDKNYFFKEGQNCLYFFPEILISEDEQVSLESNMIDFIHVFFINDKNQDLIDEIFLLQDYFENKNIVTDKNEPNVWDELNLVLKNDNIIKYLNDYNLSFDTKGKNIYNLSQNGKVLAEISYLKTSNQLEVKFLNTKKKLRLDNFTNIKKRAEYTLEEFQDSNFEKMFTAIDKSKVDLTGFEHYLILGKNEKNVDTIILATINHTKKQITLISVPRDLWVNSRKINSYYYFLGINGMVKQLENILGVKIKNYILIDMYAFPEVIDKVGGIDFTFDAPLIDPTYYTIDNGVEGTLYFPKGKVHLTGIQALRVARTRHTSSDFARAARQQQILKALKERLMNASSKEIGSIIPILLKKVDTDFSLTDILILAPKIKNYEIRSGNVMSTGNILTSDYFEYNEKNKIYILKPRDDNWELIKQFVINAIYSN